MDMLGDNRFEIIASAKKKLLEATNIETSKEEMMVLDSMLFRMWQMGWLPGCKNEKPVVRGEWIGWEKSAFHGTDESGKPIYRNCIIYEHMACGFGTVIKHNFCPRCGADMRGDQHGTD